MNFDILEKNKGPVTLLNCESFSQCGLDSQYRTESQQTLHACFKRKVSPSHCLETHWTVDFPIWNSWMDRRLDIARPRGPLRTRLVSLT